MCPATLSRGGKCQFKKFLFFLWGGEKRVCIRRLNQPLGDVGKGKSMRETSAAMTLVMTVAISLTVTLNPVLTPRQNSVDAERVILSFPRKEMSLQAGAPLLVETKAASQGPDKQLPGAPSGGVLASRGGQAFAKKPSPSTQPASSSTQEDLYWLARVIASEAKGESMEGQVAVGAVIMNRVRDPRFPKTIKEVIFAKGQFDPVRYGSIDQPPSESAVDAAKRVLQGENPVPEALYFYNPTIATDQWIRSLRVVKRIGNHVFATR